MKAATIKAAMGKLDAYLEFQRGRAVSADYLVTIEAEIAAYRRAEIVAEQLGGIPSKAVRRLVAMANRP